MQFLTRLYNKETILIQAINFSEFDEKYSMEFAMLTRQMTFFYWKKTIYLLLKEISSKLFTVYFNFFLVFKVLTTPLYKTPNVRKT